MSSIGLDSAAAVLFAIAATGLLGSPGPAIAALLAVGRTFGLKDGMRFYLGLQLGLGTAAAISAAGLISLFVAFPAVQTVMVIIATAYLLYLAWKIGSAPVSPKAQQKPQPPRGGFLMAGVVLGMTNPKAYVAFASLMGSYTLVTNSVTADGVWKWGIVVTVMIVVDILWLLAGVLLGRANLPPFAERVLNLSLALMILLAALLAFL